MRTNRPTRVPDARLNAFPAFFKVAGKRVVVVGNGEEALAKTRLIANTHADIVVVADAPEPALEAYVADNHLTHECGGYAPVLLEDAVLVFAATGDEPLDRRIVSDARAMNIPANAVDQPDWCDFYTPALVNRAPVAVAIGTEGAGPVLAQMIRAQVDRMLSPTLGATARLATAMRPAVESRVPRGAARRTFWRRFFSGAPAKAMDAGQPAAASREAERLLDTAADTQGHVWLVGAGPGAEDLLTLRAQRVLMEADVIVHDALVPQAVIDMGRRDAIRIPVGKRKNCHSKSQNEINDLLIDLGKQGKRVARLKSGDPLVFGRAGEELDALRGAGIGHEVVPGVTSAFAAAADLNLPLTLRGVASSLVLTTGHDLTGDVLPDWAALALSGATIAVYMGRSVAAKVAGRLMEAGMPADTTVAIIENASRADRRFLHGVLGELPGLETRTDLSGPVMVLIGDAVAGAEFHNSTPLSQHADAVVAA